MTACPGDMHVTTGARSADAEVCAGIWARATGRRDGRTVAAESALPGVLTRLDLPGAELLVAHRDGLPVGFTVTAQQPTGMELFYLGVDPDAWGSGVARRLLLAVEERARDLGHDTLELWVLDDNQRAIDTYTGAGWAGTNDTKDDHPSGRAERRFVRRVSPARS